MQREERNAVQLFALQTVVAALVKTHPNPGLFAAVLEQGIGMVQVEHIGNPLTSAEVRQEAREFAQEFVDLAKDEVQARQQAGR